MTERDAAGPITVDELAQEIRRVDGDNTLGAGALAEAILEFIGRRPPSPKSASELAHEILNLAREGDVLSQVDLSFNSGLVAAANVLRDAPPPAGEIVAWVCDGKGDGWEERDKITFDRETAEYRMAHPAWTVRPLGVVGVPADARQAPMTETGLKSLVDAVWQAVLSGPHTIVSSGITLSRSDRSDGNATAQLHRRINDAVAGWAGAQPARTR